jgi:hypothetical protein
VTLFGVKIKVTIRIVMKKCFKMLKWSLIDLEGVDLLTPSLKDEVLSSCVQSLAKNGQDIGQTDSTKSSSRGKKRKQPPEYLQKYEKHLGGLEVGKDASQSTAAPNRTYGFGKKEEN